MRPDVDRIRALARTLGIPARELIGDDGDATTDRGKERLAEARAICRAFPGASFEGVWHTLYLLDLPPIERLQRSLTRGRALEARRRGGPGRSTRGKKKQRRS